MRNLEALRALGKPGFAGRAAGALAGLVMVLAAMAAGQRIENQRIENRRIEDQRIEGVDLQGKKVDPLKAAAGKPVVLVFVRTDCPISNRYAPTIERLQAEYAGRAAFWLVYPDNDESTEAIQKHLQEYGYVLPALRDPGHELVRMGQAEMTPEVAVIAGHGQLAYHGRIDNLYESIGRSRSAATTHELQDALDDVLAGKMPRISTAKAVGCYIVDMR